MEYELTRNDITFSRGIASKRGVTAVHSHEFHELYYMRKGSTTYFIEDEIYRVEKGSFVLIPRGILHMTDNRDHRNNERLLLYIPERMLLEQAVRLWERLAALRVISVTEEGLRVLEEFFSKLEEEFGREGEESDLLLELYVLELLALLCRYRCEPGLRGEESDGLVYQVSEYISSHFEQDITLEELGKIFGVSQGHLSRKFKEVSGMGLNEYLTYVRISNAERMLQKSRLPITEVAKRCGFNGSNYFSAVFKKVKGITPLSYRRIKGDER